MHILFFILKIAGISVILLLALLIFLLILLLFVPFRYRLDAKLPEPVPGKENGLEQAEGKAVIRFLFVFLMGILEYKEGQGKGAVRLLGIPLWQSGKDEETQKNGENQREKEKRKNVEIQGDEENRAKKEEPDRDKKEDADTEDILYSREEIHVKSAVFKNFPSRLSQFFKTLQKTAGNVSSMKNNISRRIEKFNSVRTNQHVKSGISKVWNGFKYLFSKIKPQKSRGFIHFGFEDPSWTGQFLGALGIGYAFFGDTVRIEPDFERKVFYGNLTLEGKIQIYVLIKVIWRLYRDREVKYTYKRIKNL